LIVVEYVIFIAVGYLIGSVPFGLIAARMASGVDVRDFGSGKTGMTNVIRTSGKKVGILVLLLDMSKAVIAIAVVLAFSDTPGLQSAAGLAALLGHNFPVFAGFRGGRGIATGWGGLFILSPWAGLIATGVGVPLVFASKYVSVGSLVGAVAGCVSLIVLAATGVIETDFMWYGIVGAPAVVIRHYDNILRLMRGEERKLGSKAEPVPAQSNEEPGPSEGSGSTEEAAS
jgi:acyl phosphate:glycerol-3-phosphate acyltransferase